MALTDKLKEQSLASLPSHQRLKELNELSKVELENSLLKELLAEYQESFLQLKKEQDSSLQNLEKLYQESEKKVNQLQQSNDMLQNGVSQLLKNLKEYLSKEIETLSDSNQKLISGIRSDVNSQLTSKLEGLSTETANYIRSLEVLKDDSKNRFKSFYGRWGIIDKLVIVNLTIVPILLLVLSYAVFFKK